MKRIGYLFAFPMLFTFGHLESYAAPPSAAQLERLIADSAKPAVDQHGFPIHSANQPLTSDRQALLALADGISLPDCASTPPAAQQDCTDAYSYLSYASWNLWRAKNFLNVLPFPKVGRRFQDYVISYDDRVSYLDRQFRLAIGCIKYRCGDDIGLDIEQREALAQRWEEARVFFSCSKSIRTTLLATGARILNFDASEFYRMIFRTHLENADYIHLCSINMDTAVYEFAFWRTTVLDNSRF